MEIQNKEAFEFLEELNIEIDTTFKQNFGGLAE